MTHTFNTLVQNIKKYNPSCDFSLIKKAFDIAYAAHSGQLRKSGEPYITHPLDVAIILSELELDSTSIVAGILHDVLEDTNYTMQQIKDEFGQEVAQLVDGVTKLNKISYSSKEELHVENLRKMFLAMAKDIRVILIKLADRLHNIRTLKYSDREKQIQKAQETMDIYAPLAHRLGISKIKWELEDLCLRYLDPEIYYDLVEKIAKKRRERESFIKDIMKELQTVIQKASIEATIDGRPKHFYSIYRKMKRQNKPIDEIFDLFALRVIVETVQDCYAVLGLAHELYKPIPGKFKDYIAMPKPNMYQSLHTIIISSKGYPVEIQIRTREMHKVAEVGIAAHWKYKDGESNNSSLDKKLAWIRQLIEWQKEMQDAQEFMETLKIDLFTEEVFVFTPTGDVLSLPMGSSSIDFAYTIHSDVGNKMMGAKVNGKITPLEYTLQNGDIVEILTSSNIQGPSRDWLNIVKSSQARNKINQWFRKQHKEEDIAKGKDAIEKELKKQGFSHSSLFKTEWVNIILKKYNARSLENLYSLIGHGAITANRVISRLKDEYRKEHKIESIPDVIKESSKTITKDTSGTGIIVKGIANCLVKLSRCCNPVPGDEVIGYITKGKGVSVHRKDCINIRNMPDNSHQRFVNVEWIHHKDIKYAAEIIITGTPRPEFLMEVTNIITESKIAIKSMDAKTKDDLVVIRLALNISDTEHLSKIIQKISRITGIVNVSRN